ncbi:YafY family transcriptional regulator, partial [Listeria monocytogenes]
MEDIVAVMQIEIKIRIHQSIIDRVLDYCSYENFHPDGEEHYIVSFPFIENEYHYDILLSFGDKCECLEPLHIR